VPVPISPPNTAFRSLRRAYGWTQQDLVERLRATARQLGLDIPCDVRHIRRWENGDIRWPRPVYRDLLSRVMAASPTDMGFVLPGTDRDNQEGDSIMQRRQFLAGMTATAILGPHQLATTGSSLIDNTRRKLGGADVRRLQEEVSRFQRLDNQIGGDRLRAPAAARLRELTTLLTTGRHTEQTGRDLQSVIAGLGVLTGWLCSDADRQAEARRYYTSALRAGREARDPHAQLAALQAMSLQSRDLNRPREVIELAQRGRVLASRVGTSRQQALLAAREAGGWALLRDARRTHATLTEARRLFIRETTGDDPAWMEFFEEDALVGMESVCHADLGDHRRATLTGTRCLHIQSPRFARRRLDYTTRLARTTLHEGDIEQAASWATTAIQLSAAVTSSRVSRQLNSVTAEITRHNEVPAARELAEEYRSTLAVSLRHRQVRVG
jgi:transcriptional regulator with XRE-family HTH domain